MAKKRWWVRFKSMRTGQIKINSFDTEAVAKWFAKRVNGEILDWK